MSSVLIALNAERIRRSVLNLAYDYCREMHLSVDVLLVGGGEDRPAILADFLSRLARGGRDVRLHRKPGPFGQAVHAHARRDRGVYVILVDSLKSWGSGVPFEAIRQPVAVLSRAAA